MSEDFNIHKKILDLFTINDLESLKATLMDIKPADIADILERIEDKETRIQIFNLLDDELGSDVLLVLDRDLELDFIEAIPEEELADIVEEMAPDDAADFMSEIENKDKFNTLLGKINEDERKDILNLLSFDEENAGGIMTSEFLSFPGSMHVENVLQILRVSETSKDPVMFVYAVEPNTNKFLGSVSLVDLIKAAPRTDLIELIEKDYVWSTVDADQEEVAKEFRRYKLWVMPVLDDQHRLVGRITADDILNISAEEADEDIAQMTGTPDLLDEDTSAIHVMKRRLPWLIITLCLALINSIVIDNMLSSTGNIVALAVFLPVIMAMGGNTGMQSATVIIREMAMERIQTGDLSTIIKRESFTGFIMGILCGLCGGIISYTYMKISGTSTDPLKQETVAMIVFIAVASAMTFSSCFGSGIPLLLQKLGFDPAVAAGPFVTTLNDIISSVIYFLISYQLIDLFANSTSIGHNVRHWLNSTGLF
ncbi:MAG: magnesium transporter [Lentisphaeraceae bacterium]|nr:magnesium transporter [Lentisphaeraceae bacterium]